MQNEPVLNLLHCLEQAGQATSSGKGRMQKHRSGPVSRSAAELAPMLTSPRYTHLSPLTCLLEPQSYPHLPPKQALRKQAGTPPTHPPPAPHPTQQLLAEPKTRTLSYLEKDLVCICDRCSRVAFPQPCQTRDGRDRNTRLRKERLCLAPPWPHAFAPPSPQNESRSFPCAKIHL